METVLFYITAKNREEAQHIGKTIVEERIAACVNIFDTVHSIYHWKGTVCEDNEAVLIAKTQKQLSDKLIRRVRELHSYTCPCIVELPIASGNLDYLQWINEETNSSQ